MNAYTTSDVVEIGNAQEIILGGKGINSSDETQPRLEPASDLDE